jgi:GntR family transcriptional regulator of vanillate catabolism
VECWAAFRLTRALGKHADLPAHGVGCADGERRHQIGRAFIGLREMLLHGELARASASRSSARRPPRHADADPLALERLATWACSTCCRPAASRSAVQPAEALDAIELRGVLEGTAARFAVERLRRQ